MAIARWARSEDVPAILELVCELAAYAGAGDQVVASETSYREALFGEHPSAFAHVVECADAGVPRVVGYSIWYVTFSTWLGKPGAWIDDLYVCPEYRGSGYGTILLDAVRHVCMERDYGRMEWAVHDWNAAAITFYKRFGALPKDEFTIFRLDRDALAHAKPVTIDLSSELASAKRC